MQPQHNPAGSFDFGAQLWGMGEPPDAHAEYETFGLYVVDPDTVRQGWQHIDKSYHLWCEANPPTELPSHPFGP